MPSTCTVYSDQWLKKPLDFLTITPDCRAWARTQAPLENGAVELYYHSVHGSRPCYARLTDITAE